MVIDFDTSVLPRGVLGWYGLLDAIKVAHPNDENQWIEFKANVDPSTAGGRAHVARAIVAFANRDPASADQWLGGHALIVIGLEPGNLVGTPEIDPADLYNKVNALLASPAPGWDAIPVVYEGQHILVITVDPPRQGDPIAVIGKSSGDAEDGHVLVRKVGKSDRATSADIRRLSARLMPVDRSISGITIKSVEGSQVPGVEYPRSWLEDWLYAEELRLLSPLDPPPTRPIAPAERRMAGLTDSTLAGLFKRTEEARKVLSANGGVTREETRTEEEFREEVATYLDDCRTGLEKAFKDLRQSATLEVRLEITNTTESNFEQVLVELHIEGDVHGYEDEGYFGELADYLPRVPRKWGPWTEGPFRFIQPRVSQILANSVAADMGSYRTSGPSPTINNGGSVSVTCVPVHLYPRSATDLLTIWLVGEAPQGGHVRVAWTATASNVDGKLDGAFTIPVLQDTWDLSEQLLHSGSQ